MTYRSLRPMMMVRNLKESVGFYTDVLGFTVNGTFPEGDDPLWASLSSGNASLMLNFVGEPHAHVAGEEPHSHEPEFNGVLYVDVTGSLEDVHARVEAKASCTDIEVMPYGMKEFSVVDPNGYKLTFGVPAS